MKKWNFGDSGTDLSTVYTAAWILFVSLSKKLTT